MSGDYWLGFATPFALLILGYIALEVIHWFRWWFINPQETFRGGRGSTHVVDVRDDGRWYPRAEHTHWWPPGTPWWLVHRLEPIRVWLCHRSADHRPASPKEN